MNSEDFFAAKAQDQRDQEIKKLQEKKEAANIYMKAREAALKIIRAKGPPSLDRIKDYDVKELKAIYRWKIGKTPTGSKGVMLATIVEAPEPAKSSPWTEDDEAELQTLILEPIRFNETALKAALTQNARAVTNSVEHLDDSEAKNLMAALIKRDSGATDGNNNDSAFI